jgi:hypothetical protein
MHGYERFEYPVGRAAHITLCGNGFSKGKGGELMQSRSYQPPNQIESLFPSIACFCPPNRVLC